MKTLRELRVEYLALRRSLGFKLLESETKLDQFVSFMEARGDSVITTQLAVEWAQEKSHVHPSNWAKNLSIVRLFAEYCSYFEPRTEIPAASMLPYRYQRKTPHIYSSEEIVKLVEAARSLRPCPHNGLRPWTYSTLFGLLATTGLRIGEAVNLQRDSLDLQAGELIVRLSKFGKSRLVPLHSSTVDALKNYAERRDKLHPVPRTPWFFVRQQGGHLDMWDVRRTFIELQRLVGLRGSTDHHGPRLHDFRHSFAVRTLLRWYQTGADVEQKLPILSTYLGHAHPSDTYWYLTATPELLAQATMRMEKKMGGLS